MNQPLNVDPEEIGKFDRISQLWWDPHGKMGMLHVINPLRARFIFDHAEISGAKVVDVGCGGGILTETLAKAGADTTGLDQSELTLAVARQHADDHGLTIDYRLQTVEQLADEMPGRFDVVTCLEMLEHVPDPAAVISACSRLLKPGGKAVFSTINRSFKAWLFAIVGGEYILRLLPRGTHQYRMLVKPAEMRAGARDAGLQHIQSASLIYNPLTRKFRVAHNREDVNYMAAFVKKN